MSITEERDQKINDIIIRCLGPKWSRLLLRAALEEAWEAGNRVGNRAGADYCTRTVAGIEEAMDGQRDGAQE